jgi:hypothetical protein
VGDGVNGSLLGIARRIEGIITPEPQAAASESSLEA